MKEIKDLRCAKAVLNCLLMNCEKDVHPLGMRQEGMEGKGEAGDREVGRAEVGEGRERYEGGVGGRLEALVMTVIDLESAES